MFAYENSVGLRFVSICRLKRFMSCKSDSSVQTVVIIGLARSL